MLVFVTGGTGFIGRSLVQQLLTRGDTVRALVRTPHAASELHLLGAEPVLGDITDRSSLRTGMDGCDWVFHVAAWYKIGAPDWQQAERINVEGTRNVLELAFELGIPRIVYTSTIAVYGDTGGRRVDESYIPPAGPFLTEYDRTKWLAHYQVARPLIEKGAPIVIVMPGAVYGPGDHSLVGDLMRRYYLGQFPIFPAPQLTLCFSYVDDVAAGHILAAEKGHPGESYHLTGPVASLREMTWLWSDVTGVPDPLAYIPPALLTPFAPLMGLLSRILPLPALFSRDSVAILNAAYTASAEKARQELGWETRPVRVGMRETFAWIAKETGHTPSHSYLPPIGKREAAGLALAAGAALLLWRFYHRRKH